MTAIDDILARGRFFLAPMAGVTEAPFRAICKRMGAALTYTEMVSTTGLHYSPHARAAEALLRFDPAETPVGLQIFGANPQVMGVQAAKLVERLGGDIALVDINMGCPVTKVVAKGEGSALMREPALAAAVVSAVVEAVAPLSVTVKFRTLEIPPPGPGLRTVTPAIPIAQMSDAGISAVSWFAETNAVVRLSPFHLTMLPETKLLPLTVSRKALPPAFADSGLMPVSEGTGLSM